MSWRGRFLCIAVALSEHFDDKSPWHIFGGCIMGVEFSQAS